MEDKNFPSEEAEQGILIKVDCTCRFCFEKGPEPFISPCRCTGTMQCIHESCLKRWILSKYPEVGDAKCEICGYSYKMQVVMTTMCKPRVGYSKRFAYCCIIPILIVIILVMIIIEAILETSKIDFDNNFDFSLTILILCITPTIAAIGILLLAIYKVCCISSIKHWKLQSINTDCDENIEIVP